MKLKWLGIFILFLLIDENYTESLKNKMNVNKNSSKNFEKEIKTECDLLSHVISVETNEEGYNLLMSFSTKSGCNYKCKIDKRENNVREDSLIAEKLPSEKHSFQIYHYFKFKNFENHKRYEYSCSDEKLNFKIKGEIQFPHNKELTKVITFGDWSHTKTGEKTKSLLLKRIPFHDAIVFLGDQGYDLHNEKGKVGNEFLQFAKSVTSAIPFQLSIGNHEAKNKFEDYMKRFIMPYKAATNNLYYSYDINNAHFISINSEIPYKFDENYKIKFQSWLKEDLKNTNKKWKIVYLHRPLYCSMPDDYHCISSSKYMRDLLENILMENKVDLVLAGHVHAYERLYPIFDNKIDFESFKLDKNVYKNPKYPVHLVCGTGGNREGFENYDLKDFSNKMIGKPGFCEIAISKDKIIIEFLNADKQETIEILDHFEILKN